MRCALLLAFLLTLPLAAQDDKAVKEDLKRLEGKWEVTAFVVGGKAQPREQAPKELDIAGGKFNGFGPEMSFTIDPSKKPRHITLIFKKGDKTFPINAIYEVSATELKLCMPLAPKGAKFTNERPASFDTTGKPAGLLTAKKVR